jgi:hypothetical protein
MMLASEWRGRARAKLGLALLPCVLLLAACSSSASTTGGASTPTATSLPTATATTAPVTTCAQLPGFGGAAALTLPNMEFPTGTVGKAPIVSGGGTGVYTVNEYDGCTPNNTTQLVVQSGHGPEPFTSLVLFYGWGPSDTFPAGGHVASRCAATSCFIFADGNLLSLGGVTDNGHGVITFKVFVTSGVTAPSCDPGTFSGADYVSSTDDAPGVTIPLPPLTKLGMGDGAAGSTYIPACSAGTEASVSAFFNAAMPIYGWSPNASVGANAWMQVSGGKTWDVELTSLNTPTSWILRIHRPI